MTKPHEKELRWQAGTETVQWGGLPVALGVIPEFGPLLGASAEMAQALARLLDAAERINATGLTGAKDEARAALRAAGVLQ